MAKLLYGSFVLCRDHRFHECNTSARHQQGRGKKKEKITCNLLQASLKAQKSSKFESSQGRKEVCAQNEQYSFPCKQIFRPTDKQTFAGWTKKEDKIKIILALKTSHDIQDHSCCLAEPPSSWAHECLCCFPWAYWAQKVQRSPAPIAQVLQSLSHCWGSLKLPMWGWCWLLCLVPPVTHSCLSYTALHPVLPAVLMALLTDFWKEVLPTQNDQGKKENKPNHQEDTTEKQEITSTSLHSLCLLSISSYQVRFEFFWCIYVTCDRLINVYFLSTT